MNGTKTAAGISDIARPRSPYCFGQHDDAAAFGRFVGKRGQLGRIGHLLHAHPLGRQEFGRLAIPQGDRAGLVQQQHIHVACGFSRPAAHGEHVFLHEPVDPGNADGAQKPADRGRDQAHQQRGQHGDRKVHPGIDAEKFQADHHHKEDDRQRRQQDRERDLVGCLLALGAFDQVDHVIEETLARVGGNADHQPIRQDLGAAGHRVPVAAGFPYHRRRLARDGRLVHRGRTLNDLAVGGYGLAGGDHHDVPFPHLIRRDVLDARSAVHAAMRNGQGAGLAQRVGLGLPAPFGHGFRKIGEQHREPEPEGDLQGETERLALRPKDQRKGGERGTDLRDEHDRVLQHVNRMKLLERVRDRLAQNGAVEAS